MYNDYPKTINEQIAEYDSSIIESFDIRNGSTIILDGQQIVNYMLYTYDGFRTQYPLYRLWTNYKMLHLQDLLKAYAAWTENYNPLQNYDSTETYVHQTDDGSDTTTVNHGKVNTVAAGSGTNAPTTSNYVTTDDSSTPRLETQSTQAGQTTDTESGSTTTTLTHVATTKTIGTETYTADKIETETRKKSGNIGVTTSQQMLQSEVELRLNPLLTQYIDTFMHTYTYYISGEWGTYDS